MQISETFFDCVHLLDVPRYPDKRGWFSESQHQQQYADLLQLEAPVFVQSNVSHSHINVLRGMHAQLTRPQGKLIQVLSGEIYDVFVDLRPDQASFGKWHGVRLSAQKSQQLWIPAGFAHGFLTLAQDTTVLYHCSDYYVPNDQVTLLWNDPDINIQWPISHVNPVLSPKDQAGMTLKEYIKCAS